MANIPATIIKSTGADYSDYGNALDDVAEGDPVTRVCYYINAEQTDKPKIYVYKIQGDASDFKNWANTEVFEVRYSFW